MSRRDSYDDYRTQEFSFKDRRNRGRKSNYGDGFSNDSDPFVEDLYEGSNDDLYSYSDEFRDSLYGGGNKKKVVIIVAVIVAIIIISLITVLATRGCSSHYT